MLINFPYVERDSFVHRLDPRTKLIILFVYIFLVAMSSNVWFMLGALLLSILYYSLARLTWAETKTAWVYIMVLAFGLVILNYFITAGSVVQGVDLSHQHILASIPFFQFTGNAPFVTGGPLIFSVESITFVITQLMRNVGIGLFVIPVSYTIDPAEMGVALRGMGLSDNIAYAIDLSLRFLPTIARDFTVTYDAQRARGFEVEKLRSGVIGRIARLAPLIVPVIIGSIVDSEDIISAMELRCFGVTKRTWLLQLHPRWIDGVLIFGSLALFLAAALINILGNFVPMAWFPGFTFFHSQGIPPFLLP
ncbi:MAG TPA: energy-coupling factor transporter transmembrane component T [Ktedonobacteraceae bacterium]|nr:energy-coupling factor transporter transmembrane component T [Ktedonobacteraceae bacterium]